MRVSWSLLVVVVAACTDGTRDVRPVAAAAPAVDIAPVRVGLRLRPPRRVETNGLLIAIDGHGPQLCVGSWEESLPPRCGGPRVIGLDWTKVDGEQRVNGTIFGEFHVVGDFDGETFTLAQLPGPSVPAPRAEAAIPCSPPGGRWERPNRELTTFQQVHAMDAALRPDPAYAGLWLRDLEPQLGDRKDMQKVVLIVGFVGDAASHTAEVREHWGGALCVVQRAHTGVGFGRIHDEADRFAGELGLDTRSSGYDEMAGVIRIEVVYADATHQAKVDERFGAGVVVLESLMRPVLAVPGPGEHGAGITGR